MSISVLKHSLAKPSALAFPGQGVHLLQAFASFRNHRQLLQPILDEVDDALGEKLSPSLFDDKVNSQIDLINTYYAQPAIIAATICICEYVKQTTGVDLARLPHIKYMLGHSLGEYSALAVSGMISVGTAVQLVRKRAQLMKEAAAGKTYEMRALMFREPSFSTVLEHCTNNSILANVNTTQQIVVSGEKENIESVLAGLPRRTIARSTLLPVSIPFHSEILAPIEEKLQNWLADILVKVPSKPIVLNLTGTASQDPQEIIKSIISTNSKPVQWVKSMEELQNQGIQTVYSMGPGNILHGLNSKFMTSILLSEP